MSSENPFKMRFFHKNSRSSRDFGGHHSAGDSGISGDIVPISSGEFKFRRVGLAPPFLLDEVFCADVRDIFEIIYMAV